MNEPYRPKEWAWRGNFKPKHRNIKITISLKLQTGSSPNVKTEDIAKTNNYSTWVVYLHCRQIKHGGRPPSWKIDMMP